jgi:DNA mismatch repair ATPase MutS
MKAFLMHRDQDFDLQRELPANEEALTRDLELNTLFGAMAAGDAFLFELAKRAMLSSLDDPEAIVYRQQILADCLEHPALVRGLYEIAVEAIQAEKSVWRSVHGSPKTILYRSVQVMALFVDSLKRLRAFAGEHAANFQSEGFKRLFAMLATELDDEYFQIIDAHLKELKFPRGVLISLRLGRGNRGVDYVLRKTAEQTWLQRLSIGNRSGYSFAIPDRDESGFKALSDLEGRGVSLVASAAAQSADHILSFFSMLCAEVGFYVGCLNLHQLLAEKGETSCLPVPLNAETPTICARGLYEPCLALTVDGNVAANDVDAEGKALVMITGANQGGKSTFLRSVGLAQLMMQSGMFVAAESFSANVCDGVFTHYKREEDSTMESGKLDEELSRMSDIADRISPNCILLCNESFAATNEREGSEIARQLVRALREAGIKVFFVTHLFDLAHGFYRQELETALFLRAERQPDGHRTFRLLEGEPLPTSYGEDSYRRIFDTEREAAPAVSAENAR